MPTPTPSPSLSLDALYGAVPPGPLDGLLDVLGAMENDPLGCLLLDAEELRNSAAQVVALLKWACGDGSQRDGRYEPSLGQRRETVAEAAALLAEARAAAAALRKGLDMLLPVVTTAAALVEHQTRLVGPSR